jgi:hypothetical protein
VIFSGIDGDLSLYEMSPNLPVSQILQNDMYIERCPDINFSGIISDTKWISQEFLDLIFSTLLEVSGFTTPQITGDKKQSAAALFDVRVHLPC